MKISRMISKQMSKSDGQVTIIKVPVSKRTTLESLRKLDKEIAVQVNANADMSYRSIIYASKLNLK